MAFYVVDGIDGSGKSTVARILKDSLESSGRRVELIEHPNTGWPVGEMSASLLLKNGVLAQMILTLTFFVDLVHSVFRMKCSSDNDDFIFVRYTMSVCHLPDPFCGLLRLGLRIFFMRPDAALLVDAPPEAAMRRVESRGGAMEMFENPERMAEGRARMLRMAEEEGWTILDNSNGTDGIAASLDAILDASRGNGRF